MIVFSAVVPHSPLLIPSIGKDNLKKLDATKKALETLEKSFISARPETIVVISSHGPVLPDAFSINLNSTYACTMEEFGDFGTKLDCRSDFMLIDHIQRKLRASNLSFILVSEEKLDYGVVVPLSYLTPRLPKFSIIPITPSSLPLLEHRRFGLELKEELTSSSKRIAVLASADLAHTLSKNAPGGYSPHGKTFDEKILELLKTRANEEFEKIPKDIVAGAKSCGLAPLAILAGIMGQMSYEPEILSYEAPFGIGHVVANFKLS